MAADDLVCPGCGDDEHLQGARSGETIQITCTACDLTWERDPSPTCDRCGTRDDVHAVPTPFIEKSRGTQLSITGMRVVYRCYACNQEAEASSDHRHIPPGQNPAAT